MATFAPLLQADALDEHILDAIAKTMGESDIVVLESYHGLDRATGKPVETDDQPPFRSARILVEWIRRKGRFGLDLELWGEGVRVDITQAELAREFVRRLGSPILLSDCSHFGFSWLKHDVDGSIWEVVSNTSDIDNFDLLCDLAPDHPDFCPAVLIYLADKPLPSPAPGHPQAGRRACEGEDQGPLRLCGHFGTPYCPKHYKE